MKRSSHAHTLFPVEDCQYIFAVEDGDGDCLGAFGVSKDAVKVADAVGVATAITVAVAAPIVISVTASVTAALIGGVAAAAGGGASSAVAAGGALGPLIMQVHTCQRKMFCVACEE